MEYENAKVGEAASCDVAVRRPRGDEAAVIVDTAGRAGYHDIVIEGADGQARVAGVYEDATGNIYDQAGTPLVRIVGDIAGSTGQVTVLQPDGTYRRYSRWDRIESAPPTQPAAIVRTLPQCGCGGSLGMPKLFDSFAEMSAYFLVTFYQ